VYRIVITVESIFEFISKAFNIRRYYYKHYYDYRITLFITKLESWTASFKCKVYPGGGSMVQSNTTTTTSNPNILYRGLQSSFFSYITYTQMCIILSTPYTTFLVFTCVFSTDTTFKMFCFIWWFIILSSCYAGSSTASESVKSSIEKESYHV